MSFLDQYDKASDAEKFPLVRNWMINEPLEFFAELRSDRPILETPECTLVTWYDDAIEILLDPTVFTVQLYESKMGTYLMAQDDTPTHSREKAIMTSLLNRDDLPRIREFVADTAAHILDAAPNKKLDVVPSLTRGVPIALVQSYMGFEGATAEQLAEWSLWNQWDTFHNQPFDGDPNSDEIHRRSQESNAAMKVFLSQLIPRRIGELKSGQAVPDDMVCRLLKTSYPPEVDFPIGRLAINVGGLLIGTVETTSQASAQALQELLRRPTELAWAREAAVDDVRAFDGFVFEALRFNPISPYLFRRCERDYVMARGTPREAMIRSGTIVLAAVHSAMFDATTYPDPLDFKSDRPRSRAMHFGLGLHECMGRHIGEVMIPEIVRQVLLRPNPRASSGIVYGDSPFPEHFEVAWD
jgi:cytochrome P450